MKTNNKVKITKVFNFEMAHALNNYDGQCKNVHGHTYKLHVTVSGPIETNPSSSEIGMIMDFSRLKAIVKKEVIDVFDHALVLNENQNNKEQIVEALGFCDKLIFLPFQPTSEMLILHFAEIIQSKLPENIVLEKLVLYETETSYAEWENK